MPKYGPGRPSKENPQDYVELRMLVPADLRRDIHSVVRERFDIDTSEFARAVLWYYANEITPGQLQIARFTYRHSRAFLKEEYKKTIAQSLMRVRDPVDAIKHADLIRTNTDFNRIEVLRLMAAMVETGVLVAEKGYIQLTTNALHFFRRIDHMPTGDARSKNYRYDFDLKILWRTKHERDDPINPR